MDLNTALTIDNLLDIHERLISASTKWTNLGLALGIGHSDLTSIQQDHQSSDDRLRVMLALRLTKHGSLTWNELCESLKSPTVGHANVAKEIEDSFAQSSSQKQDCTVTGATGEHGNRKQRNRKRNHQDEIDETEGPSNIQKEETTSAATSLNEPRSKQPRSMKSTVSQDDLQLVHPATEEVTASAMETEPNWCPKVETLRKCFPDLVIFLRQSSDPIADHMFAKKVLSSKELRDIINFKSKDLKIRELLLHVIRQTELKPATYDVFVKVLKDHDGLVEAVQCLEEIYDAFSHNSELPNTETQHEPVQQKSHKLRFRADTTSEAQKVSWSDSHGTTAEGVAGDRHVLFIVSNCPTTDPDIVSRRTRYPLTEEERRKLEEQGVPRDCHQSDLTIMQNRYLLDERTTVVGILAGERATSENVKKQVKELMSETHKAGVVLHYIGPGKEEEGDWCFKDGFISFREIMELYTQHFKGRVLTIVSDCSYSGAWVTKAMKFLENKKVGPCGHDAKKKEILIKVFASCQSSETPAELAFSTHCVSNNKKTGDMFYRGYLQTTFYEIHDNQHPSGLDYTLLRCGKKIDEECLMTDGSTWKNWSKGKRIYAIFTEDISENPTWRYGQNTGNTMSKLTNKRSTIAGDPNTTAVEYSDVSM